MDIFEHARNHHRRASRLAGQIREAQSDAQRSRILQELKRELREHEWLESDLIYPALRESGDMQQEVGGLMDQHEKLRSLSSRVSSLEPHSEDWRNALDELASCLGAHASQEESQVFPHARETLDDAVLDRLERSAGGNETGRVKADMEHRASEATDWLDERKRQWTEQAQRRVRSVLEEQGRMAADRGHEMASAMREIGEHLRERSDSDRGDMSRYVVDAADVLDRWANRLENGEVDRLLEQVRSAARRHPGLVFGGALGAGFLIARFLKSSSARDWPPDEHEASEWAQRYERVEPGL